MSTGGNLKNPRSLTMLLILKNIVIISKKTWKGIRSIVNIKNSMNPKISQLNLNGTMIDDPKLVVNEINNFFVNVGPNTEKDVPKVPTIFPENFLKNRNQYNLIIAHTS